MELNMKVLLGAVAVMLIATPAMAQPTAPAAPAASSCAAIVPPPTLPDGATADYSAMEAGNATFRSWADGNRSVLECRRAEVEAAQARWQALRTEFNAGADTLRDTNTAWEADVAEFNDRNQERRR
jgi:hypothetical protein